MSGPLTTLNLGAGAQSTTVALMAVDGELPPIDHAILADTQWEAAAVYAHLGRLTGILQGAGIRSTGSPPATSARTCSTWAAASDGRRRRPS
jgi:hypothetical protein